MAGFAPLREPPGDVLDRSIEPTEVPPYL